MPTNINNEQTKSMYKITRLICFQFCLQISKYQEAKASKKVHTDTGDDILPKKCCNTGPDRDAVDDDNEHPRKDAHCHHLQLRIRVGNGRKREGRQSGSRRWSVSVACPGLLDIDCVSHVTCVRLTHASYQSTEDNFPSGLCSMYLLTCERH